jgi:hypothetical protein
MPNHTFMKSEMKMNKFQIANIRSTGSTHPRQLSGFTIGNFFTPTWKIWQDNSPP